MGLGKFLKKSKKVMQRAGEVLGEGASLALDPRRIGDRAALLSKASKAVFDVGTVEQAVRHPSKKTIARAGLEVGLAAAMFVPVGGQAAAGLKASATAAKVARAEREVAAGVSLGRAVVQSGGRRTFRQAVAEMAERRVAGLKTPFGSKGYVPKKISKTFKPSQSSYRRFLSGQ